jgi:hypothetical protein
LTQFLASAAGLAARMLDVCPSGPLPTRRSLPALAPLTRAVDKGFAYRRYACPQAQKNTPRQYQNAEHQPYLSLPRPPQTRAAHFKRLYRK